MTTHDRFIAALLESGRGTSPTVRGKYTVLTRDKGGYWFVGRSGALRYGRCASKSLAMTDAAKERLLAIPANGGL